ncbi:amidase domain-containing protein [Actinoplanes sp. NPDC026670]|uniref:amidase domain-containing protein n=1 Tax=Actinoplanes sp. NPDC026670 TaxID=3154700 RepID=UPI00340B8502
MLGALSAGSGMAMLGAPRPAAAAASLSADDITAIRAIVHEYFQKRADGVTRAGRRISTATWRSHGTRAFADNLENDVPSLFDGRGLADTSHGGYAGAETSVKLTVRAATGNEVTLAVQEITSLHFAGRRPRSGPASVYRLDHTVRLTRQTSNRWELADAVVDSDGALPPLTQPRLSRTGRKRGTGATGAALGPASAVDRESVTQRTPMRLMADRYYHGDMQRYAAAWALGRNPAFPDYHGYGGDCTSFLSQIMWAGGWETVGPPGRATRSKWFYGGTVDECSYTWGAATNFHSFAITYSQRLKYQQNLYYCYDTDVIQYDWDVNNTIDHTQFVSENVYDEQSVELYMTQHDNDYHLRPLTEILADLASNGIVYKAYGMSHTVW